MSPDERIAVCAAKQHGVVTAGQARAAGLTNHSIRHRIRTGRWRAIHRGVYAIAGVPSTAEQRIIAAVLAYGPIAVAASLSAAWLLGLLERPREAVCLVLPAGQHRKRIRGTQLMQVALTKSDVRTIKGIRCTAPERTIVDLAAVLSERALEAALDDAVQLGLTTVPKVRRYIRERNLGHRPGMKVLRRLLEDRTAGVPQKELEKLFLRKLRAAGLPDVIRQHPCGTRFIDVAYPDAKLAIELDGLRDHFSADAFKKDRRRQNEIVLAGYTVLRFTWEDVRDRWPTVEATIRRAL
jgi:very-short-patch-repair endonuclease